MSILIKGIEMPKDDELLCINIKSNGDVYYNLDLNVNTIANAIRVPPHGRLIDADKFERIKYEIPIKPANYSRGFGEGVMFVQKLIMDAPTIIPSDKED